MTLGDLLLKVGITGLPEFKTQMGTVGDQINKVVRDSDKAFSGFDKVGAKLTSIGTGLTAGVTLPLVGVGVAALNVAGNFEQTLAKITAFGDISGDSLAKLRQQALDLGSQTQFSAQQAADGMAVFASAGFDAQQIYQTMPGTLQLAAAGQLAISDAATITKDVLGQFALAAGDSGHVADVLAQAAADSSASLAEMATTLTYAGPVAKGAGQSLEETTAAIVALDSAGIRAEKAGTGLRGMLGSLLSPSSEAAKTMAELGVNVSDAGGNILPLSNIMEQFRTKLQGVSSDAEKQNIIFGVFGREAGNAAQVLINKGGPALDAIQDKLVNSTGAADRMAKTLNSGLNYAMDQLGGSVETAAIALGTALIPFAKSALGVLTDLLNDFVIPAVTWFGELPGPVQTLAIGLAGVAAAAGPVLLIGGQMASAFASIGSAVTTASGLLAKFPALATAASSSLAFMGQAALVAGAAFAAFKLGEWLSENIPLVGKLSEKFAELYVKIPGVQSAIDRLTGATQKQAAAATEAEAILKKQEAALAKHGVTVDKAGKSQQEYAKAVSEAVKELASHSKAVTTNGTATDTAAKKTAGAATSQKDLNKALSDATSTLSKVTELYKAGKVPFEAVVLATADQTKAQKALDDQFLKTNPKFAAAATNADLLAIASARTSAILTGQMNPALEQAANEAAALSGALNMMGDLMEITSGFSDQLANGIGGLALPAWTAADAMRELGVTSSAELKRASDSASDALDTIEGDTSSTTGEIEQAWQKATAAQIAYARSIGDTATADSLQAQLDAHTSHGSKVQGVWKRTAQQVSTIISDLGKGFAGGIIKLFDNSENDKLDQQADELRTALGSATEEYERHVAEVGAELAGIPSAYSAALESLGDDTAGKLADVSATVAEAMERLASDSAEKIGSLDEKYAEDVSNLKERFEEVTVSAAKQLTKQLKDLDEQLADRKKGYQRSTEDANKSYERDTRNLKESLDDKERDYRHWLEDQNAKLYRLEGDNSASAIRQREDIKRELDQRLEDMEDTRADIAQKLQDEEDDLKLSLARKKADYDAELKEVADRQDELRSEFTQRMSEEEADLAASLAKKEAQYIKDRDAVIKAAEESKAQVIAKAEEQSAKIIESADKTKSELVKKFGEQTDALKAELAKAVGEYDAYKTGVADKLKALEDAHKGPLQRIGDMFKSVFSGAGEALLRFAGEEVMGMLFGKLDTLLGKIPGIGSALGGIFGGGASAAGSVAGAAGQVGGAAAGAGSSAASTAGSIAGAGIQATIGMVTGIIGAGAQILSMFGVGVQGSMNDHLKQISNATTRVAQVYEDLGLRVALQTGMNNLNAFTASFGELYLPAFASLMTTQETAQSDIGAIRWYADHMSMNSDAIRSASELHLPQLTAIKMAIETQKPSLTINVTGYVGDREALIAEIDRKFQQAYAFQGA